jgi:hypothetical protein
MRIRRVYIKKAGGELASEACYTAYKGFMHLGYPLDFFEWDELRGECLPLDRLTLVVGGAVAVRTAFRQIGVESPRPLNLPEQLLPFAGRRVWDTTLGVVRRDARLGRGLPIFIKPLLDTKSFAGCVIEGETGLDRMGHFEDNLALQAAEPITFDSEWRYFVHRGVIVGLAHYRGDWSVVPDSGCVREVVLAYTPAPVAYSLDLGVSLEGRTLVIEANDAFALGPYGLDAVVYARMLEDRWLEIVGETATPASQIQRHQ